MFCLKVKQLFNFPDVNTIVDCVKKEVIETFCSKYIITIQYRIPGDKESNKKNITGINRSR